MKNIIIFFIFAFLSACGKDDSSTVTSSITGTFIDDPVQGLSYTCSSGVTGITNTNGEFICNADDRVTFSLGGRTIGTIKIQSTFITPYTFFPNQADAAINFARLLQSVDTDGDANNGKIVLSEALVLPATLNFASATFDTDVAIALISAEEAKRKLNKNILSNGGAIPAGENIPVANAGSDQAVSTTDTVTLDGRASSDVDNDTLSYQWLFVSKPNDSNAVLASASTSMPTYAVDLAGDYVIQLIVHDGKMHSLPDTVTITATAVTPDPVTPDPVTPTPSDTAPPIITLIGNNPISIVQNTAYVDEGATANDAVDGTITVFTTGSVKIAIVGEYTLTYTATDKAGNKATAMRTINVTAASDVTPPTQPTLTSTPTITRENTVSVEVNGEANASLLLNGVSKGSLDAEGKTTLSLDTSGDDGSKTFSITLKDSANNESSALVITIVKDSTAPNTNAEVSELQTDDVTPALDGKFPTGDNDVDTSQYTIAIIINGVEYNAINNKDGTWSLADDSIATLGEGFYDVVIIVTDEAGNETRTTLINKIEINNSGFLIDSALEGIKYISGQYNGYTDADGMFKYEKGATVIFYMGDENTGIPLGSATTKIDPHNKKRKIITLFDLVGTQDEANQKLLNMGRLLQALDSDNDVSNGITLDARTKESIALLGLKNRIDFDVDEETFSNNNDIYSLFNDLAGHFGEHRGLIETADAKAHLVAVRDNTLATKSIAVATTRGELKQPVVLKGSSEARIH